MFFCPLCSNFLFVDKPANLVVLLCKTCPYIYKITNGLNTKTSNKVIDIDKVMGEDEYRYASTCEKKCIKCDSNTALFMEIQTRSADEPMTIFYECVKCKVNWKET